MRIYLTTTDAKNSLVGRLMPQMRSALAELEPRYSAADVPARADAVLFIESGRNKFASYRGVLLARPEIVDDPSKCFIYDFTDAPAAFLPGLYTAMPRHRFNPDAMRAIPSSWDDTPENVFELAAARAHQLRPLLFSFRGFRSSAVRTRLFAAHFDDVRYAVSETHDWWNFDPSGEARLAYLAEMSTSLFALAPRGRGTTTLRLYEIMRLGRAPVILSDEWVPPADIPWTDFAIHVNEARVEDLVVILKAQEPWAREMGENARSAWERWCRPGPALMRYLARAVESLLVLRPPDFDGSAVLHEWWTARFMWRHGWHPLQRLARSVRKGELVRDLRRTIKDK